MIPLSSDEWNKLLLSGAISSDRLSTTMQGGNFHESKLYAKLENNHNLTNKSALFFNMKRYYEALGRDPYQVMPLTFHIRKGCNADDREYQLFLQKFKYFETLREEETPKVDIESGD